MTEYEMNIHHVAILSELNNNFLQKVRESVAYYYNFWGMQIYTCNLSKKYDAKTNTTTEIIFISSPWSRLNKKRYVLNARIKWSKNKRPLIRWIHTVEDRYTSDKQEYRFSSENADLDDYFNWYDTIEKLVYKNKLDIPLEDIPMLEVLEQNKKKLRDYKEKLDALITTDGDSSRFKSN